jgi:hypothetical protein
MEMKKLEMKRNLPLRAALLAAVGVLALVGVGAALAFNSGGNPGALGANTITWTGQGADGGVLNTTQCDENNTPYLLWILTTDGGSAKDATLNLGGTGTGNYAADTASGNTFHFTTPYVTPDSNLTASADFTVLATGNGSWNLVISHGCPGVETPPAADLTVSKDATPSFKRTYAWGITKDVDKTLVKQFGGTATFNYTVNVTHDAGTDSDWQLSGTITVSNPNDFDVTGVDITDPGCTVTGGDDLTVPANDGTNDGTAAATYTCTLTSGDSGTNTATATWPDIGSPNTSDSGDAGFDFSTVDPTIVDGSVTVTDTIGGSLGTALYTDSSPEAYNYPNTVNVPAHDCTSYNNTATFTAGSGATGSASKSVTACGPATTGALTMGFWQNKNGQAIITSYCNVPSAGGLRSFLRSYLPFQDLSSTATCAQVATYVSNVIKAANASGASMNAMLKAQMLATALDVYFSDPVLGGNRINAANPIGGKSVDLTLICATVVNPTLSTVACLNGITENAGAAFGSSTSLTVSQILAYAAGQSNVGGSNWYLNTKATQELAKDTFDAINNQLAFAP